MTDQNNCYAYFCIRDSFDPEQITKRLGVEPTETFREGELIPKTSMTRKTSLWALYSRLDKTARLEDHINDVLNQLDLHGTQFEELSREFEGILELVGYFYAYYPGLVFERELVQRLARYSLAVDFDFYNFGEAVE
jgi:hypothetical protein